MRNKLKNSEPFECDILNYSKSGRKYWLRIQSQPQFDETGKLKYFFAIETDITWTESNEKAGLKGMMVARQIALISYRNYNTYNLGQTEDTNEKTAHFKSESYQQYQGIKLARRFNAFSYYFLSRSMDAHNVGRQRGSVQEALNRVHAKTLVISISSDILFPPKEQEFIAKHIDGAVYKAIDSTFGHDGFLLEFDQIQAAIKDFFGEKTEVENNLAAEKNVLNTF